MRGRRVSIHEQRPVWRGAPGDWTSMPIAQLRYEGDGRWTLYFGDRNGKWTQYFDLEPASRLTSSSTSSTPIPQALLGLRLLKLDRADNGPRLDAVKERGLRSHECPRAMLRVAHPREGRPLWLDSTSGSISPSPFSGRAHGRGGRDRLDGQHPERPAGVGGWVGPGRARRGCGAGSHLRLVLGGGSPRGVRGDRASGASAGRRDLRPSTGQGRPSRRRQPGRPVADGSPPRRLRSHRGNCGNSAAGRFRASWSRCVGLKAQVHSVLAEEGVAVPYSDLFGVAATACSTTSSWRRRITSASFRCESSSRSSTAPSAASRRVPSSASRRTGLSRHPGHLRRRARAGRRLRRRDRRRHPVPPAPTAVLVGWGDATARVPTSVPHGHVAKQGSKLVRWAAVGSHDRRRGAHQDPGRLSTPGRTAEPMARVAAARELLTLVYYGLRDGHIHSSLARKGHVSMLGPTTTSSPALTAPPSPAVEPQSAIS